MHQDKIIGNFDISANVARQVLNQFHVSSFMGPVLWVRALVPDLIKKVVRLGQVFVHRFYDFKSFRTTTTTTATTTTTTTTTSTTTMFFRIE